MKKITGFILIILFVLFAKEKLNAQIILSDEAEISLLTASPGNELYSVFGHSAVWIHDPVTGLDRVYNYGTFDFNTPNFYIKFIRGKLHYMLSVSSSSRFIPEYHFDGRGIVQQVLNLKYDEKQAIFDFLHENSKPENKYYLYDFFFDNCATRIRDLFDDNIEIEWHEYPYDFERKNFRELVADYVEDLPWEHFGIDIALGLPVERKATAYEYMFLPDHMYTAFANAKTADGEPLVINEAIILEETLEDKEPGVFTPRLVFWIVFAVFFIGLLFATTRRYFAKAWMIILGLIGLFLLPLFLFTDHSTFTPNLNLLWAVPFHLVFVFFSKKKWGQMYFKVVFFLTLIMAVGFLWLPQTFHPAVFPILLTSILCSAYLAVRNTE
ncbi:MAG: DUF4105 domain-containing protein [Bacteroidales bacterium]